MANNPIEYIEDPNTGEFVTVELRLADETIAIGVSDGSDELWLTKATALKFAAQVVEFAQELP